MPQMIIANRLLDGVVVFLDGRGGWVEAIEKGIVLDDDADVQSVLASAKDDETRCVVVDPNLIDVDVAGGSPRPTAMREAIRAFGPSVRTDLASAS